MRSNGSKTAKNTMNALKRILEYIGKKSNGSKTAKNTMNALKRILECIKKKVIETNNFHNYKHVTSPIIFSWEVGGKEIFQVLIIRWIN